MWLDNIPEIDSPQERFNGLVNALSFIDKANLNPNSLPSKVLKDLNEYWEKYVIIVRWDTYSIRPKRDGEVWGVVLENRDIWNDTISVFSKDDLRTIFNVYWKTQWSSVLISWFTAVKREINFEEDFEERKTLWEELSEKFPWIAELVRKIMGNSQ